MNKTNAASVRSRLWLGREQTIARGLELLHRCLDVLDLETEVMQSRSSLREMSANGRLRRSGFQEFQPGIPDWEEAHSDLLFAHLFDALHLKTQGFVKGLAFVQRLNRDSNMIDREFLHS